MPQWPRGQLGRDYLTQPRGAGAVKRGDRAERTVDEPDAVDRSYRAAILIDRSAFVEKQAQSAHVAATPSICVVKEPSARHERG
jgi:hypothetical protein